jgi:hypothetical protein
MNCERCQIELEDFLYGELTERASAEVRQHLVDCSGCAAERDKLESENSLFAEFYEQTAIDPLPESWEAIRARIAAEPVHFNQSAVQESKASWWQAMFGWLVVPTLARQAALAVLLIAFSVAATFLLMRRSDNGKNDGGSIARQEPTPTPQVIVTPSPAPMPATDFAQAELKKTVRPSAGNKTSEPLSDQQVLARQLTRTEREYQNAIKLLDQAVAKRRSGIDPEAFKKYESSLALIDSSIAQSKRALRELPNDLVAGQFLLAAYARKVELMQEIAMQ